MGVWRSRAKEVVELVVGASLEAWKRCVLGLLQASGNKAGLGRLPLSLA